MPMLCDAGADTGRSLDVTSKPICVLVAPLATTRMRIDAAAGATMLELDLRGLEYVDSVGLSAIIEADRRAIATTGGRARLLVAEEGPVRRMLELTLLHLSLDVRIG